MASFLINTKAEFLKSRRTLAYRLAFLAGMCLPILNFLAYVIMPQTFMESLQSKPWENLLTNTLQMTAAFMPIYVTMLVSLVVQTEYRNNTWKTVYTQPRSYADIFFSKFVVIQLLLLASLLVFNLMVLTTGYLSNVVHHKYAFFDQAPPIADMLRISTRLYVSMLCVGAIQYWISLRFKNFITSMSIGLAMTIAAIMIMKWDNAVYFPYAYSVITYFKTVSIKGLAIHEIYSLIGTVVVLLLGFWNIATRKERG